MCIRDSDGVDIDTGIGTEDDAGNVLSDDVYLSLIHISFLPEVQLPD